MCQNCLQEKSACHIFDNKYICGVVCSSQNFFFISESLYEIRIICGAETAILIIFFALLCYAKVFFFVILLNVNDLCMYVVSVSCSLHLIVIGVILHKNISHYI